MEGSKDYTNIEYSSDVVKMFAELIQLDRNNLKIFLYVARKEKASSKTTVADISENVIGERRVRVKNSNRGGYRYQTIESTLERKTVEKVVDRLFYAGLIYFKTELPHKHIHLTVRGVQVLKYIASQNKTGDGVNG